MNELWRASTKQDGQRYRKEPKRRKLGLFLVNLIAVPSIALVSSN